MDITEFFHRPPANVIERLVEQNDYVGVCLCCGAHQDGCEPDAREYTCEACGRPAVFGASEILIAGHLGPDTDDADDEE
jgi:hypothetical protein